MDYEFRNPVRFNERKIDCELEHPSIGWVPFTCDRDEFPDLYARLEAALD